jgi:hypothetical protein
VLPQVLIHMLSPHVSKKRRKSILAALWANQSGRRIGRIRIIAYGDCMCSSHDMLPTLSSGQPLCRSSKGDIPYCSAQKSLGSGMQKKQTSDASEYGTGEDGLALMKTGPRFQSQVDSLSPSHHRYHDDNVYNAVIGRHRSPFLTPMDGTKRTRRDCR